MNFCLSDLVPPLRWSDATGFARLREAPGLPDAWWRSVPLSRVFAVLGPEALGELITELATEHWPAAAVGDILPALHVMDPEEADEPQVSIALDRVGSYTGLLALTGRELADQPFIRAKPLLNALFTAVFTRLAPAGDQGAHSAEASPSRADDAAGGRASSSRAGRSANGVAATPPSPAPLAASMPASAASSGAAAPASAASFAASAPAPADPLPVRRPAPPLPKRRSNRIDAGDPLGLAAARLAEAALQQQAGGRGGPRPSMFTPPPRTERPMPAMPAMPDVGLAPGPRPFVPEPEPFNANGAEPFNADPLGPEPFKADPLGPEPFRAAPPGPEALKADPLGHEAFRADPLGSEAFKADLLGSEPFKAVPSGPEAGASGRDTGPFGVGPRPAEADPLAAGPGTAPSAPDAPSPAGRPGEPGRDQEAAAAETGEGSETPADGGAVPGANPTGTDEFHAGQADNDVAELIDAAFADLDDKTWAVAQNHVFTDAPAAPEELAKLFAVPPEDIVALEQELRARLAAWLDSAEAAPYTQHLEKLPGTLGVAAPKSRLMGAAEWHTRELRSLDVPAWQFVLTTLPGYTVQDDWLVAGDIADLRDQTCALILNADRPPTVARALELVSTLGIHPEVAKEWLENVPQLRIQSTKKTGENSGSPGVAEATTTGERPAEAAPSPEAAPAGQLKDVSMTRKCFKHPDGLWWLRVDVAPEQLAGGECPLPSGFAAYLGLSPGDGHTVTGAAGDVTLSWQSRPVIESLGPLLQEMGAQPGSHLFLTVAEEDKVLRARLVPAAAGDLDKNTMALRLAGYTTKDKAESLEETIRVLATRVGMTGPVGLPDLMNRLRERGDRDLLSLMV
ncbi:hypothetical protein ABZU32_16770 [Sphaerisporangium sp. NPDC005288]|uniref:hypothetical protein n=1 Tax=Sphaerisporangium sp. NPDC005288 TaxID=3155114 RepID=UPI0033A3E9A2